MEAGSGDQFNANSGNRGAMRCAAVKPMLRQPATASGRPEVTIKASTAAIKARLLSLPMDRRFNVTKDTKYLLQIEKPTGNFGAAILHRSKYDSVPAERIVFTFAPLGDSVASWQPQCLSQILARDSSRSHQWTPARASLKHKPRFRKSNRAWRSRRYRLRPPHHR
jgi:hypothetical protein